jgi:hypothetical protein
MDSDAFDELFEFERKPRKTRSKPVKRKWREIELLKDRQRLLKELQDIDMFRDVNNDLVNY